MGEAGELVVFRVPRGKVVRAARLAIRRTRRKVTVDGALSRRLMRIAREDPEFALGQWRVRGRCGCLIGNLFGWQDSEDEFPQVDLKVGGELYEIGIAFDEILRASLSPWQLARWNRLDEDARVIARVA